MPYYYARQRKAEAGLIVPVLKQLYDVIQTIDDIASNWCLHPNHLFGALPRHKLCYLHTSSLLYVLLSVCQSQYLKSNASSSSSIVCVTSCCSTFTGSGGLPTMWSGCCYPALMSMGTTVYAAPGKNATVKRARRQLSSELMDTMPIWYNGYKLYNPWTTPAENLGWSLLLIGGGTAAVINKINGLAWSVLALANLTETALSLLNDEVKQIRDAVVQNRLALDMLSSERVFVRC